MKNQDFEFFSWSKAKNNVSIGFAAKNYPRKGCIRQNFVLKFDFFMKKLYFLEKMRFFSKKSKFRIFFAVKC